MKPNDTDERHGLPSASSALYDSLCPGRWLMQKAYEAMVGADAPEEPEPSDATDLDADADAGRRIHLLYAGEPCPEATQAELRRVDIARQIDQGIYTRWLESFHGRPESNVTEVREFRWWLKDDEGNQIYSGQTDLVKIRGRVGGPADVLVGDLKGLWGHHDDATINMQLRRYVALIYASITDLGFAQLDSAWVYLNQPAVTTDPKVAVYGPEELQAAAFEMHVEIAAMMDENAPRTAGPVQCKRCRGKLLCPEFSARTTELPAPVISHTEPPAKTQVFDRMAVLDGNQLAMIVRWAPCLRNMADMAEAEAKRRLRINPFDVPGFELKKNPSREKIIDLVKVWNRMTAAYAVNGEQFLKMCTITKSNCERLLREHGGLKGRKLDEKLASIIEGATMPIHVSDSIVETKLMK